MTRATLLLMLLTLAGCASWQPPVDYVPVPIACPAIQIPQKPRLPIADITPSSPADTVIKAYAATVYLQSRYIDSLLVSLGTRNH